MSTVDNTDPFRANMRDSAEWQPTSYRSHTIGQVVSLGDSLIGSEVTVSGYAETVRGRGIEIDRVLDEQGTHQSEKEIEK